MILLPQVEQVLRYWRRSAQTSHFRRGEAFLAPLSACVPANRATHALPLRRTPGAAERKTRCGDRPGFGWLRHSSQGCLFLLESRYIVEGFFGFPRARRRVGAEAGWSTPKNGRRTVARIRKRYPGSRRAVRSSRLSLRSCGLRGG